MAIASDKVKHLQLWSGRIGHAFLVLASAICAYGGWVWGDGNIIKGLIFGLFMALTPWAVAYLLPFVSVAKAAGRPLAATSLACALVIAGLMEWRAEMMVFAGQRNTSAVTATHQQMRYEAAQSATKEIEAQLKVLQAKLAEQAPYGPSAAYASQIKDAEDLAQRESSKERSGCKAKCDAAKKVAADLRAKQAIALDREQNTEPEIKRLTKDLEEARQTASNTKPGDTMSGAESDLIAAFWTGKLKPGEDARKWTDLWLGAFMALFLLVIPTSLIYASQIDWSERPAKRPGLIAKIKAWMSGEKLPEGPVVARETVHAPATIPPIDERYAPPPRSMAIRTQTISDLRSSLRRIAA